MMSAVCLQMMERYVPRVEHSIAHQRHFLPMRKRTHYLHGARVVSLSVG